jgi:hypothetical protein
MCGSLSAHRILVGKPVVKCHLEDQERNDIT